MENKTEELINFISKRLSQADKENTLLRAKGKFDCLRASHTQKRMAEDIGSYVIKNIIRTPETKEANISKSTQEVKNENKI